MNRLLNALAFAVVVIAFFVTNSHLPQRLASSPLAAHLAHSLRGSEPAVMASLDAVPPLPPQIDEARMERIMERAQRAQQQLARIEMKGVAERVRVQVERGSGNCKVVRIDQ